jgi:putative ABC transport system substrate-binding protein
MRRREFITVLGGVATAWPLAPLAQTTPKTLRLGMVSHNPRTAPFTVSFERRLRELGYVEGQNLVIEFIDTRGQVSRIEEGMREVVRRNVDIILAGGPEVSLKSALAATSTLPIVMIAIDYDPFALGYVKSLARPGGQVTGILMSFDQTVDLKEGETIELEIRLKPTALTPGELECMLKAKTEEEIRACLPKNEKPLVVRAALDFGGYTDSTSVNVFSPSIRGSVVSPTGGWNIGASYALDVLTAASPDVVATASRRFFDQRHAVSVFVLRGDVEIGRPDVTDKKRLAN